jgi:hypothetical protein
MGDQWIAIEIECDRAASECTEFQAILARVADGPPRLSTDVKRWPILRWDSVEITTAPVDFRCVRYRLSINLAQKASTKVRSTISDSKESQAVQRRDLVITLEDGIDLGLEHSSHRSESLQRLVLLGPHTVQLFELAPRNDQGA